MIQRCNARKEMKTFRLVVAPLIGLVPIVPGVVIFFVGMLQLHWKFSITVLVFFGVVVVAFLLMLTFFLLGQNFLPQRLVKEEIRKL